MFLLFAAHQPPFGGPPRAPKPALEAPQRPGHGFGAHAALSPGQRFTPHGQAPGHGHGHGHGHGRGHGRGHGHGHAPHQGRGHGHAPHHGHGHGHAPHHGHGHGHAPHHGHGQAPQQNIPPAEPVDITAEINRAVAESAKFIQFQQQISGLFNQWYARKGQLIDLGALIPDITAWSHANHGIPLYKLALIQFGFNHAHNKEQNYTIDGGNQAPFNRWFVLSNYYDHNYPEPARGHRLNGVPINRGQPVVMANTPVDIIFNGVHFSSTETLYQAYKSYLVFNFTGDPRTVQFDWGRWARYSPDKARDEAGKILNAKIPTQALKTFFTQYQDQIDNFMYTIVRAKFLSHNVLARALLLTYPYILIEGTDWGGTGDDKWGIALGPQAQARGQGLNKLGYILMKVRDELRGIALNPTHGWNKWLHDPRPQPAIQNISTIFPII